VQGGVREMWALHLSEVIAHPDGAANHVVAGKLAHEARLGGRWLWSVRETNCGSLTR
jgi:hypothetical protein